MYKDIYVSAISLICKINRIRGQPITAGGVFSTSGSNVFAIFFCLSLILYVLVYIKDNICLTGWRKRNDGNL